MNPFTHFTSIGRRLHAPADDGHGSSNIHDKPPIKEFVPTRNHSSRNGTRIDFGKWVVNSTDGEANVRSRPEKAGEILRVLKNGDAVGVYEQTDGWSRIDYTAQQWVSTSLLAKAAAPGPAIGGTGAAATGTGLERILAIAEASELITYKWGSGHGRVARGYTKGMALAFGRAYCKLLKEDPDPITVETAKAVNASDHLDALVRNGARLNKAGIPVPSAGGVDMLLTVYTVLMGLGVNESDGKWHEGMYGPDDNATHDTAEAGMFQTSFNITYNHENAQRLYAACQGTTDAWLPVFQQGVPYEPNGLENHGHGPGVEFQELSKYSPTFAAEMAALRMRTKCTQWAPLRDEYVLLTDVALRMFREVKAEIDKSKICPVLLPALGAAA